MSSLKGLSFLRTALGHFALASVVIATPCLGGSVVLWYNGDYDLSGTKLNQIVFVDFSQGSTVHSHSIVYDDFVVPAGQSWTITSAFSNDLLLGALPTLATVEIRSGVAIGDEGKVVALLAQQPVTLKATGRGIPGSTREYTVSVDVTASDIVLASGVYWLAVYPFYPTSTGASAITATSGANGVDIPASAAGDAMWYSATFNATFSDLSSHYSEGLIGSSSVPEPSSCGMFGLGAILLFSLSWRKQKHLERTF